MRGEIPGTIGSLSLQGEGWGEGEYAAQMLFSYSPHTLV